MCLRGSFRGRAQRRSRNPFSRGPRSWIPGVAFGDPGMTISTREHHILLLRGTRGRESSQRTWREAAMDETAAAIAVRSENTPVLLEERTEGVLRLVMNRPAQRNALSVALMSALQDALERAAADQACRVIIIAGAGPAFCAGHDLRELRSEDDVSEARRETYRRIFAQCSALMLQIVRL